MKRQKFDMRPIESVPKDGSWHLGWSKRCGFATFNYTPTSYAGRWYKRSGQWHGAIDTAAMWATHYIPLKEIVNVPKD